MFNHIINVKNDDGLSFYYWYEHRLIYIQILVPSSVLSKVWLMTEPRGNDMWYHKLKNLPNINNVVEDIVVSVDMVNAGRCLALSANLDEQTEFTFTHGNCADETMSVVCKLADLESSTVELLPRFPCRTLKSQDRKKRSNAINKDEADVLERAQGNKGNQTQLYMISDLHNFMIVW